MISCKRATELISASMEQPLGLGERIALRTHLLICSLCRNFRKNLSLIRRNLVGTDLAALTEETSVPAPLGAKERLKAFLRKNRGT